MPRARNHAPSLQHGKLYFFVGVFRRRLSDSVIGPVKGDDRHIYLGTLGKVAFHLFEARLTWRVVYAMTIGVDNNINEIRIVKGRCSPVINLVGEMPRGRPGLP